MSNSASTNDASTGKTRYITMACGHRVSVHHGTTKEESDEIVRSRKKRLLCDKCCIEHETNSREATAIIGCRHARCTELTGTEKQIKWAEVIRFAHLYALDAYSELVKEDLKDDISKLRKALSAVGKTRKWIKSISEATWWIENHAKSFNSEVGLEFWQAFRNPVKIIRLAVNILIISPSMKPAEASALDLEDQWNNFVKEKANAEAQAKESAHAIIADKELEPELVARARALAWHGEIKPWWRDGDNRLFLNDMGNCSICWIGKNFDETVRFWRMDDTPESRQLAKDVWKWCMSEPNSDKARSLTI